MVAMMFSISAAQPVMQRVVRFNPLTPQRIAERRAAVMDFISAALFCPVPALRLLLVNQEYANECS